MVALAIVSISVNIPPAYCMKYIDFYTCNVVSKFQIITIKPDKTQLIDYIVIKQLL